jgi:Fe-S oxidoreductase
MLFEMLQGDPVGGGWKSEDVKSSLDLCLSCKGCKGDCPVHVDMATYKAEFLSHYYQRRLRPRYAYAFGLIHWWSRLAAHFPRIVNFGGRAPVVAPMVKRLVGMADERSIPRFAPRPFSSWYPAAHRPSPGERSASKRVILWPDTFNDHFYPETLAAAAIVMTAAGWTVVLPKTGLCCGRPLYDYGMLDQARRQLRSILAALRDDIVAGTPVVGLEPSCVSVFRDELVQMFHDDEDAQRLSRLVFTFGEFMARRLDEGWVAPQLAGRKAIVHGHCHQKAVMQMEGEFDVLRAMKIDFDQPEPGCCGMAGAFGFERDKYAVSLAVGERGLLPAVRDAAAETLIIADGFSCRQQIDQTTARRALHLAEVVELATHATELPLEGGRPERLASKMAPPGLRSARAARRASRPRESA